MFKMKLYIYMTHPTHIWDALGMVAMLIFHIDVQYMFMLHIMLIMLLTKSNISRTIFQNLTLLVIQVQFQV